MKLTTIKDSNGNQLTAEALAAAFVSTFKPALYFLKIAAEGGAFRTLINQEEVLARTAGKAEFWFPGAITTQSVQTAIDEVKDGGVKSEEAGFDKVTIELTEKMTKPKVIREADFRRMIRKDMTTGIAELVKTLINASVASILTNFNDKLEAMVKTNVAGGTIDDLTFAADSHAEQSLPGDGDAFIVALDTLIEHARLKTTKTNPYGFPLEKSRLAIIGTTTATKYLRNKLAYAISGGDKPSSAFTNGFAGTYDKIDYYETKLKDYQAIIIDKSIVTAIFSLGNDINRILNDDKAQGIDAHILSLQWGEGAGPLIPNAYGIKNS